VLQSLQDDLYFNVYSDLPLPCSLSAIVPDFEGRE
jgi:hypothetical protein